jgi:hypothetical protein
MNLERTAQAVILLLFFAPLITSLAWFISRLHRVNAIERRERRKLEHYLAQDQANQAARRLIMTTRLQPDGQGNYPLYYNPKTGDSYEPTPGNLPGPSNWPAPQQNGSAAPRRRGEPPMQVNVNSGRVVTRSAEPPVEAEQGEPFDVQSILVGAFQRGEGVTRAFQLAGIPRGGGEDYKYWRAFWDKMEAGVQPTIRATETKRSVEYYGEKQ